METDLGKLFIGGISWDTDEKRLREYFGQYGEVVEAVIMRDRITGRARGFGFVIFADPNVAEGVVMEKHMIDGRTVEAKRAVPREDQHVLDKSNNSIQGSPGLVRTKKIFVGGLASTVTESNFKKYFDQFGTITDVVIMYDRNTQRPRGFGFITYDSEDAVDRVLCKTFHELNGKMVEVKQAVPKELSPSPIRSPLVGYNNYGFSRTGNFNTSYPQGYNFSTVGGYGRFNPIAGGRSGFLSFGSTGYGMDTSMEPVFGANYGTSSTFVNSPGRLLSPGYSGNLGRFNSSIGYGGGIARNDSPFSSTARNVWGMNSSSSPALRGGIFGASFGTNVANWSSSPLTSQVGGSVSGYAGVNSGYSLLDSSYGLGGAGYGRNAGSNATLTSSFPASIGGMDSSYGDLYRDTSIYGDSTWGAPELDGSGSLGLEPAGAGPELTSKTPDGYITNRQPKRGVAA